LTFFSFPSLEKRIPNLVFYKYNISECLKSIEIVLRKRFPCLCRSYHKGSNEESVSLWQRTPGPCVDVRVGSRYGFYCWRREDVVGVNYII
jgi:hypothetical protein